MMTVTADRRPHDTRHSRWLSAGSAQARIGVPDWPAVARPILSRDAQNARSHRRIPLAWQKPDHRNRSGPTFSSPARG